jgi:hypothetical protein
MKEYNSKPSINNPMEEGSYLEDISNSGRRGGEYF